jgi:flavin-dependent dehydrogenase
MALRGGRIAGEFLVEAVPSSTRFTRDELKLYQERWQTQLGRSHAELYRTKTAIFQDKDTARQDRVLFETLGNYFGPESKFRKV